MYKKVICKLTSNECTSHLVSCPVGGGQDQTTVACLTGDQNGCSTKRPIDCREHYQTPNDLSSAWNDLIKDATLVCTRLNVSALAYGQTEKDIQRRQLSIITREIFRKEETGWPKCGYARRKKLTKID